MSSRFSTRFVFLAIGALALAATAARANIPKESAAAVDAALKQAAAPAAEAESAAAADYPRVLNFARLKRDQLAPMRARIAAAQAAAAKLRDAVRAAGDSYKAELLARNVPEAQATKDAKFYAADRETLTDLVNRLSEQEEIFNTAVLGLLDLAQAEFGQWFATAVPRLKPDAPAPALPYGFKFKNPGAANRYRELVDQALAAAAERDSIEADLRQQKNEGTLKLGSLTPDDLVLSGALSLDGETPLKK
jgi:hypothetical protein